MGFNNSPCFLPLTLNITLISERSVNQKDSQMRLSMSQLVVRVSVATVAHILDGLVPPSLSRRRLRGGVGSGFAVLMGAGKNNGPVVYTMLY